MHYYYVIENSDYQSFLALQEKLLREFNFHLYFGGMFNKRVCVFVEEDIALWLKDHQECILDGPYESQE